MLTGLLERFYSDLPSTAQACPPAALNNDEIDRALCSIRSIKGALVALEVNLAGARAARRGHGDGGASTLKELGGMSARQARQSVATAKTLRKMRAVQDAVQDGHISPDNAARLALAARKTSPQAVESDSGLLAAAQHCASDDFATAAGRWEQAHQNGGGMGEHLANRRKRYLRFWNQHGMVYFKGRTDLISGTALQRRLEQLAQQLRRQDAKTDPKPGNGTSPQPSKLTFGQAMLDALDTTTGSDPATASITNPDRVTVPDTKPDRGLKSGTEPESRTSQRSASSTNRKGRSGDQGSANGTNRKKESGDQNSAKGANRRGGSNGQGSANGTDRKSGSGDRGSTDGAGRRGGLGGQRSASRVGHGSGGDSGSGMPKAEIVVVMDLLALLGDDNARCEIPAVGPIPASIARQLAAANDIVPILLDGNGEPLRHGGKRRLATRAQWQALIARDGACIGCGADPLRCEAHHDPPFSQTGRTWIEELALLCYECHHKVHDQNWQIVLEGGKRALRPPDNTQTSNPRNPHSPRNQTETAHHQNQVPAPTPETHQPPLLC